MILFLSWKLGIALNFTSISHSNPADLFFPDCYSCPAHVHWALHHSKHIRKIRGLQNFWEVDYTWYGRETLSLAKYSFRDHSKHIRKIQGLQSFWEVDHNWYGRETLPLANIHSGIQYMLAYHIILSSLEALSLSQ